MIVRLLFDIRHFCLDESSVYLWLKGPGEINMKPNAMQCNVNFMVVSQMLRKPNCKTTFTIVRVLLE